MLPGQDLAGPGRHRRSHIGSGSAWCDGGDEGDFDAAVHLDYLPCLAGWVGLGLGRTREIGLKARLEKAKVGRGDAGFVRWPSSKAGKAGKAHNSITRAAMYCARTCSRASDPSPVPASLHGDIP
jgi:hypothetical protein